MNFYLEVLLGADGHALDDEGCFDVAEFVS